MAAKRMFSKTITNSSRFLMMPQSSQNLYFHLGMNADDDGFCEHFSIMRMTESKPDDLNILRAKQFVEIFDDHVLIILDWKENNLIRSDRYTPSKYLAIYKAEIKQIESGIPNVNQMDTQVRLGKVRLGKDKEEPAESDKYLSLAKGFYNLICDKACINNILPKEPDFKNWSDDIRKIIEIDKRDETIIKEIMSWVVTDDFEKINVRCPSKLRKRFDTLNLKMEKQREKNNKTNNSIFI